MCNYTSVGEWLLKFNSDNDDDDDDDPSYTVQKSFSHTYDENVLIKTNQT